MATNPDSIPRYAPPGAPEPEPRTCGECAYYREAEAYQRQPAEGVTLTMTACICMHGIWHAKTLDELAKADVSEVEATDPACKNFEEDRWK